MCVGYVKTRCHLCKEPEHPWIFVSPGGSWKQFPRDTEGQLYPRPRKIQRWWNFTSSHVTGSWRARPWSHPDGLSCTAAASVRLPVKGLQKCTHKSINLISSGSNFGFTVWYTHMNFLSFFYFERVEGREGKLNLLSPCNSLLFKMTEHV